jgi:protocatechuate 3,4-dioxygenase beta subunit
MRTPSQTVGPFFALSLCEPGANELVARDGPDAITVHGRVLDGEGAGVDDSLIEIWHPDLGFARCGTDADGRYEFVLRGGPPYVEMMVFARGLLRHVTTRMYLPGEDDTVLAAVPADRRATLVAEPDGDRRLRFDIHLQGDRETVFFDV